MRALGGWVSIAAPYLSKLTSGLHVITHAAAVIHMTITKLEVIP